MIRDPLHEAALALQRAQDVERLHLSNQSAWRSMPATLQKEYSASLAALPADATPTGPAQWLINKRLSASETAPWDAQAAVTRHANSPAARTATYSWIGGMQREVDTLTDELRRLPLTRENQARAGQLEQQIALKGRRLERLTALDPMDLYLEFNEAAEAGAAAGMDEVNAKLFGQRADEEL